MCHDVKNESTDLSERAIEIDKFTERHPTGRSTWKYETRVKWSKHKSLWDFFHYRSMDIVNMIFVYFRKSNFTIIKWNISNRNGLVQYTECGLREIVTFVVNDRCDRYLKAILVFITAINVLSRPFVRFYGSVLGFFVPLCQQKHQYYDLMKHKQEK